MEPASGAEASAASANPAEEASRARALELLHKCLLDPAPPATGPAPKASLAPAPAQAEVEENAKAATTAARAVEAAVFQACSREGAGSDYRTKVRALAAALRRSGAEGRARVRAGFLAPELLASAGGEEHLLTASQRKRKAEDALGSLEACLGARVPGPGGYIMGIDCSGRDCHEECERRHLDERERSRREWPPLSKSQLVICAGPERSGSTWLYNAVRLLYRAAKVPCDSYWINRLTKEKLAERLAVAPPAVVCVKTHEWHADYEGLVGQASHVILTHRDLRGVCASYRRLKWNIGIPDAYVENHMEWRRHQTMDIAYESIVYEGLEALRRLAQHLSLPVESETEVLEAVHKELCGLQRCHLGNAVCQVTKLWPNHVSSATRQLRDQAAAGSGALPPAEALNDLRDTGYEQVLNSRFREFQALYGYV